MENKPNQQHSEFDFSRFFFWLLWAILLLLLPLYGFTLMFEASVVKSGNILSTLSPIIGLLVLVAQIIIAVKSFNQMKQNLPLSKPYLTLLGGSILIGFIWAGGCAIMGPWSLH